MIKAAWQSPAISPPGGESSVHAQKRGVDVLHKIVARHPGQHIVVSTHGDLLALMINGLDRSYGCELWRHLSFPDVYRLTFEKGKLTKAARDWEVAAR